MPKRGRPAQLSREQIVAAALGLDLETLTMRALAQRLGVTHSTLYGWVANRAELLDLISAVTVEKTIPTADPLDGDWRTWLADLAWPERNSRIPHPVGPCAVSRALSRKSSHSHHCRPSGPDDASRVAVTT